jgi:hypothetical protein
VERAVIGVERYGPRIRDIGAPLRASDLPLDPAHMGERSFTRA